MMGKKQFSLSLAICIAGLSLQACNSIYETFQYDGYTSGYSYNNYNNQYDNQDQGEYYYRSYRRVNTPRSYHFSNSNSPKPHRARDRSWANQQDPNNYTIELKNGENPASVANTLHKTPKNARTAQIKYKKDGKTRYTGVYGTYKDKQSANKALQNLPPNIKSNAGVKPWSKIQNNINAPSLPANDSTYPYSQ